MFTGIIEEIGTVISMTKVADLLLWDGSKGEGYVLVVSAVICLEGCYLGASVAVNGTCLTVTEFDSEKMKFGVAPETLRCTNLGKLIPGSKVNLERAAVQGGRNSGHYVQGHVDCTGEILQKWREGESLWIKVRLPKNVILQVVHKGYIAIDGTSLTICEVNYQDSWFTFMLVQYTQTKIIVPQKEPGELVNIEIDVLGKYVASSLSGVMQRLESLEASFNQMQNRIEAIERV